MITPEKIDNVAHLARLAVEADERKVHSKNLSNILDMIAEMDKTNTDGITPMAHPLHGQQPGRPDEVTETNQRDVFQKLAPLAEAGLYLVPQVIE